MLTSTILPVLFLFSLGILCPGFLDEPERETPPQPDPIAGAVEAGLEHFAEHQHTTDLTRRVSSLQVEVSALEQEIADLRTQVEHQCVWEHEGLDGEIVTTILPLRCERPVRSRSVRVTSTAYYSPLPGQASYATGSLAGDRRLNGQGVRTADGTSPYPGTVAAPPAYAFGTVLYVEGFGAGTVHDRGSAIQRQGGRDRLDLWMGHGDEGLQRSREWGIRRGEAAIFVDGASADVEAILERHLT